MAYTKLFYPPTSNGLSKTLDAALDKGMTTSLTLSNVTGIQNKPGVVVINRIDSNSTELSTSLREYVSYTAVSGKTLTGLARHLGGTTDQDHAVGSVVEFISDITWGQAIIDAFLVEHKEADATHDNTKVALLAGAQTFTGAKTFTRPLITTSIDDSGGNEIIKTPATASAVNEITVTNAAANTNPSIAATGGDTNINLKVQGKGTGGVETFVGAESTADHTATGLKVLLTATANVVFGDVCYIASTGKATLVDADAIASSSGIVMATATINADAEGEFLLMGVARDETWAWTVGGLIYITVTGTSTNTLSQSAPTGADDVIQIVGVATHADRMFFNPQLVQIEHT